MLRNGFACWDPRHTYTEYRGSIHNSGEAAGPSACCLDWNISQHHRNWTANVEAPSWAGPLSNLFANAKPKRFRNGHSLQASGCVLEQSIVGLGVEELHPTSSLAEVSGSSSCTMFSIRPSRPSGLCFKESFASRCFGYPYAARIQIQMLGPLTPQSPLECGISLLKFRGFLADMRCGGVVDVDLCRFLSVVKFSEQIFHLWLDGVLLVQELMDIGRNQRESEVALPASYSVVEMTRIWRQLPHGPLQQALRVITEYGVHLGVFANVGGVSSGHETTEGQ
ncbi:hypothetical protein Landi51_09932 [Colletotrichum acutatum]